MKTTQEALQEISGVNGTQQECLNVLAFNSAPTGTAIDTVTIKGGVVRVIDSAVGDIARTTSGWIEDEKYGAFFNLIAGAGSGEIDNDVLYEGHKTIKLTTTSATGRLMSGIQDSLGAGNQKYWIPCIPSTVYKASIYARTVSVLADSVYLHMKGRKADYTEGSQNFVSNKLTGTTNTAVNEGFVKLEVQFTTLSTDVYLVELFRLNTAGDGQTVWFAPYSFKLEPVSTITNSGSAPALLYPKVTAVTSSDNIDQSQATTDNSERLGELSANKYWGQQFLPTKKNFYGCELRRGSNTGIYTGDVTVSIFADSSNAPTGSALASYTIPNAIWNAITDVFTITIPLTLTVDGSTKYWIVIMSSTVDASNYTRLSSKNSNPYTSGILSVSANGISWAADLGRDLYFKTLYSKNTTNFTVSTDTQTISVTAPTTDGWANGTVIDTANLGVTPLTLAPGVNNIYYSSNGPSIADGEVDASLQATVGGSYGSLGGALLTRQEACNYWAGTTGLSYQGAMNTKALTTKKTIQEAANTYLESL